jgi:WD40 repeat protein
MFVCRYKLSEDAKCLLIHRQSGKPYENMVWCENGTLVATLESAVHFLDSYSGEVIEAIPEAHARSITGLCVSTAAVRIGGATGYVAVTGSKDHKVRIWAVPNASDL